MNIILYNNNLIKKKFNFNKNNLISYVNNKFYYTITHKIIFILV